MGFLDTFSPINRPGSAAPPPASKTRGFLATYGTPAAEQAPLYQETYHPTVSHEVRVETQTIPDPTRWNRTDTSLPTSSPAFLSPSSVSFPSFTRKTSTARPSWSTPTHSTPQPVFPADKPMNNDGLANELQSLTTQLQSLSGSKSSLESKLRELISEQSRVQEQLSRAKDKVSETNQSYQNASQTLDRTQSIVSRMEQRVSGFSNRSDWGSEQRGSGWSSPSDDLLFSREELRGAENESQRKYQMSLALDRKRNSVWTLKEQVSSSRSANLTAESQVREYDLKLSQLSTELVKTRESLQETEQKKSVLERTIESLQARSANW